MHPLRRFDDQTTWLFFTHFPQVFVLPDSNKRNTMQLFLCYDFTSLRQHPSQKKFFSRSAAHDNDLRGKTKAWLVLSIDDIPLAGMTTKSLTNQTPIWRQIFQKKGG